MLLKLMQTFVMKKFLFLMFASVFRWFLLITVFICTGPRYSSGEQTAYLQLHPKFHPFYVSVTEFNHNTKDKIVEVSCKMFADDLESTLKTQYKTNIDILHPRDVKQVEKYVGDYLQKHLQVKINGKPATFQFIGYESEQEAVWGYLQINNVSALKKLEITNNVLYEVYTAQVSIMHASAGGIHKSTRLVYPDTQASFEW